MYSKPVHGRQKILLLLPPFNRPLQKKSFSELGNLPQKHQLVNSNLIRFEWIETEMSRPAQPHWLSNQANE